MVASIEMGIPYYFILFKKPKDQEDEIIMKSGLGNYPSNTNVKYHSDFFSQKSIVVISHEFH